MKPEHVKMMMELAEEAREIATKLELLCGGEEKPTRNKMLMVDTGSFDTED